MGAAGDCRMRNEATGGGECGMRNAECGIKQRVSVHGVRVSPCESGKVRTAIFPSLRLFRRFRGELRLPQASIRVIRVIRG
jgi:hypothetical protein